MTARNLLQKAYEARKEIQLLKRRREQYIEMATGMSGMSENAIRSPNVSSRVETAALKIVEVCDEIDRKADAYAEVIRQAEDMISCLDKPKYRQILTLKYIEGKPWKQINAEMGYKDEKSAYRFLSFALQAADKLHKGM